MFWRKKEDKVFEQLNKLVQVLETRVCKLEADVMNVQIKLRKKFLPDIKEQDDLYDGILAKDPSGKGLNP